MPSLKVINFGLTVLSLIGLGLSIYAFAVEQAADADENYVAMCDISENIKCTRVFKSDFGRGFGIIGPLLGKESRWNQPNSLLGIVYYSFMATLAQANTNFTTKFSYFSMILAMVSSTYFAYILAFILKDLCVVCVSTYAVNILNLILIYNKHKIISQEEESSANRRKTN